MNRLLKLLPSLVALALVISGCSTVPQNVGSTSPGNFSTPSSPQNTNHGYATEDKKIPWVESCTKWHTFWRLEGPAVSFDVAQQTGDDEVQVSTEIYLKNSHLDQNQDGIVCYFENLTLNPSPATAITPNRELFDASECKVEATLADFEQTDSGFPRNPAYVVPGDRKIVIQLVYVDASDLPHTLAPSKDVDFWIDGAGQFLKDATNGKFDFEWRYANKYFRLPKSFESFSLTRTKQGDATKFVQAAITAADSEIDFTDVDLVVVVTPPEITNALIDYSPAIPLSSSAGFKTAEGNVYRGTLAGADTRWEEGYLLIAHEIGHLLGLEDYYSFEWQYDDPYEEQFKFMGEFDNMNFAPGKAREWTGWSRWLLSAIDDNQVRCVGGTAESTHQLWAISSDRLEPKIAVIRTGKTSAIVIESRKSRRHDRKMPRANEGLLVYEVETRKKSGFGPLRIVRKANLVDPFLLDAPLRSGESVTVKGFKIENIESGALWDVARVTKITL